MQIQQAEEPGKGECWLCDDPLIPPNIAFAFGGAFHPNCLHKYKEMLGNEGEDD